MKVGLPTIMHTGNHLAQQHIFKDFKQCPHTAITGEGNLLVTNHVIDDLMDRWRETIFKVDHVFTVIRHPARVMESFRRRGRSLKAGDRQYDESSNFETQWKNLIELDEKCMINYIHVDSEDRDWDIDHGSELLGVELGKDWPVLGEQQGTKDLILTKKHIDPVPYWIMDFYKDIIRRQ